MVSAAAAAVSAWPRATASLLADYDVHVAGLPVGDGPRYERWARQVTRLAAATVCLHLGKQIHEVTGKDFDTLLGQLDGLAYASASARGHFAKRLLALRQACYQLGAVSVPPRKGGPGARTPAERAAEIPQPQIRAEVVRYVTTISTTLRPTTVAGRTKAPMVFFGYLAEHHPQVQRLNQIDRTPHIEPYRAWAQNRS